MPPPRPPPPFFFGWLIQTLRVSKILYCACSIVTHETLRFSFCNLAFSSSPAGLSIMPCVVWISVEYCLYFSQSFSENKNTVCVNNITKHIIIPEVLYMNKFICYIILTDEVSAFGDDVIGSSYRL